MKYLRRGIWFIAGRLLVICLVLGLLITAFYYTMNLSNIILRYMIVPQCYEINFNKTIFR